MVLVALGQRLALAALLALLLALGLPPAADAAVLGFRNDTKGPVIVQVMSLVNNVPVRARTQILMPGKFYAEPATPGNKQVIIADARQPTRILYNGPLAPAMNDQFFSIKEALPLPNDKPAPRQRQALPRVELERVESLKPPAGNGAPPPRRPQGR
jgi:hypothetical protein